MSRKSKLLSVWRNLKKAGDWNIMVAIMRSQQTMLSVCRKEG